MIDPVIHLGIDNCFASKRWTRPEDWCALIADLGLNYIEVSADTECDPLYMGAEYTADWIGRVKNACREYGVQIANVYSGHGTYSTLGMGHWDGRVRARFRDQWIKAQASTAHALDAGLGFFAHAFDESILQDPEQYAAHWETLCQNFASVAEHGASLGMKPIAVEQMYAPHQPPFTIQGAKALLRRVYEIGGNGFYITNDVGHMNGQQHFHRPTESYLLEKLGSPDPGRVWVGSRNAMAWFRQARAGEMSEAEAVEKILADCDMYPYLFAEKRDGDVYAWLEETACYSPIIHLQQSDGKSSPHWPFDKAHNEKGIIEGGKVLRAIAKSYASAEEVGLPPRCSLITLTLEPFIGTAGDIYAAVEELRESVSYWRQFVPRDGLLLSELIGRLEEEK